MVLNPSKYQDTRTWKMTPAMIRARKPFFKGNMLGLTLLLGVTGSVYYTRTTTLQTCPFHPSIRRSSRLSKRSTKPRRRHEKTVNVEVRCGLPSIGFALFFSPLL